MNDFRALLRSLVTFAIALPMAIVIGYMLAQDLSYTSLGIIVMSIAFLMLPLIFKWHHPLLILTWNMSAVAFLLPGRPQIWLVMAFVSGACALMQRALVNKGEWLHCPSITLPLIFLALVVVGTAYLRGGIGFGVLGSAAAGGKRYLMVFAAIVGYFAIISRPVPKERIWLYVGFFFLAGLSYLMADAPRWLPSKFLFLFWVFPVNKGAIGSVGTEFMTSGIDRFTGVPAACLAVCFYILARRGFKDLLDRKDFWRLGLLCLAAFLSLIGGFRSYFVLLAMTFFFMFYMEGMFRSRYLPAFAALGTLILVSLIGFADRLPMNIQRTLSVIPWIEISPVARWDATASSEWRLTMWNDLLPQVPEYLFLGKGFGISSGEMRFTSEFSELSTSKSAELASMAGDYHNGPLSVLIPFGIWGAIGFLWFLFAAWRTLLANYRYGDPELRQLNALLISVFAARVVLFMFVYGGFYADLAQFIGLVALSISANGGVKHPVVQPVEQRALMLRPRIPLSVPTVK